jgi:hypothetical protein
LKLSGLRLIAKLMQTDYLPFPNTPKGKAGFFIQAANRLFFVFLRI